MDHKECSRCKETKDITQFTKCKGKPHPHCKSCKNTYKNPEKQREYYQKNKERILANNRAYREANQAKISSQRKEYRGKNQEYIKQKQKEYLPVRKERIKEQRKVDENFRMKEILRSKIHKLLSGKESSYQDLLGCDIDTLRRWLQFQFDSKMSWNNLGTYWQIDHILPMSKFDLTHHATQKICFSWTNLQPLEKTRNRQKSNKFELHYYFNSIVSIHRFIQYHCGPLNGYQNIRESLCWLRNNSGMVKIPWISDENRAMDNPQPSL